MSIRTIKCYIEEYNNESGNLSARLRVKHTGQKVDLGFAQSDEKLHFIQFLSAAKQGQELMPDVFSKDGDEDCVEVSGIVDFDAPDEIRFVYNDQLQYVFG